MITSRAHGIDISKYDVSFNPDLATEQLDFVIQRASYRVTKDEAFDVLNPGVQKVPIRLAYHYLNSDTAWQLQADKFLSVVDGKNFHAYVCDFESSFNVMSPTFAKMAWDFIKHVTVTTGKRCILYTGYYHYKDYLVPSQTQYGINWNIPDLWIAQYWDVPNPDANPNLPVARTAGWSFWQYTARGNGTLYGTGRSAACDLNVFNGNVASLRSWLNLPAEPTPTPDPENPTASFSLTVDGTTYEANDVELTPRG